VDCICFDADIDDFATVLKDLTPTAKKQHKCHECKRIIPVGEKYHKEITLYDKQFNVHKTCLDCNSFRKELVCSFHWGELLEQVKEGIFSCYGNIPESAIVKLTPRAREMICGWVDQYWHHEDSEYWEDD